MNKITNFFQDVLVPMLIAIGENRYMQVTRNGMTMIIPFVVIGSVFTIIGSFPSEAWMNIIAPYADMINVGNTLTFGMIALIAVACIGYNMAVMEKLDPIGTTVTALVGFLILQVDTSDYSIMTENFGASGLFTAIFVGIFCAEIIKFFVRRNITIKMPPGVPAYVSDSFTVIIPAFVFIVILWVVRVVLNFDVNAVMEQALSPLVFGLSTLPGIMFLTFITCLLWAVGINGDNVLAGVTYPVLLALLAENSAAYAAGETVPHITAYGFFYFNMWLGGTGATVGLVILMMRSRSKSYRALGKICTPPTVFNINEPLVFGFPVMLNPIALMPYIATPLLLQLCTYFLMKFDFISKVVVGIPWTTPPLLSGYIATGGDWRAVIWQAACIVISVGVYYPFFKISEKKKLAEEKQLEEQEAAREQEPVTAKPVTA
ncbi:PTS sugar transporter subunit IIC [Psychromonas ossibalaenae]|uniref:PTS sugar transporter subunit IIC n=1 Tax=Psychromonas ossibalaenae TaxID=444922 RepID=UPI00038101C7|nr:PTS transporter subunit EIIC [Psychromonas ossibalaenae]